MLVGGKSSDENMLRRCIKIRKNGKSDVNICGATGKITFKS